MNQIKTEEDIINNPDSENSFDCPAADSYFDDGVPDSSDDDDKDDVALSTLIATIKQEFVKNECNDDDDVVKKETKRKPKCILIRSR